MKTRATHHVTCAGIAALLAAPLPACAQSTDVLVPGEAALARANAGAPLNLSWEKAFDDLEQVGEDTYAVWTGETHGDIAGPLTVRFLAGSEVERTSRDGLNLWEATLTWAVETPTSGPAFSAELTGIINWTSGAVRLRGLVTNGPLAGSSVIHQGQLGQDGEGNYTAFEAPATGHIQIVAPAAARR